MGTNELAVVVGLDLEDVSGLILELLRLAKNLLLAGLGLVRGTLECDLAVVNLHIDVELLAQLLDVLATLANEMAGVLLGVVEGSDVVALKLILLNMTI